MPRVSAAQVLAVSGEPDSVCADQAIDTASKFLDAVLSDSALPEPILGLVELYLAAHFLILTEREGPMAAQTIGETTERYHDIYGAGLGATRFGLQAIFFDTTGTLGQLAEQAANPTKRYAQIQVI